MIATNRHLTQGADDLEQAGWDAAANVLSGRSHVVGGDPYRLRFTVPAGWQVVSEDVSVTGGIGILTLHSIRNELSGWRVEFKRNAYMH